MREAPEPAVQEMIERSAAPAWVEAAVGRLWEKRPVLRDWPASTATDTDTDTGSGTRPGSGESPWPALVAVLAASRSLTRLVEDCAEALDVVARLGTRPDLDRSLDVEGLVRWKHLELLRIAARDLVGIDTVEVTGRHLARLARDVLTASIRLSGVEGLAVVGMGKLGGDELNYSSDIDVMFVGELGREQDREARRVLDVARRCFRMDTNLRPEGRDGPLVRTVESYLAYWERWAQPWEFQALLKAAPAAGDEALGRRWADAAAEVLWSRRMGAEDLRSLRSLKARAEAEVSRRGLAKRDLKRAPGGIRDIEFTVQLLQLVHGHSDPALRSPTTLVTLRELADAGYVDPDDAGKLFDAYRYLRAAEHRLQLVDEQQVHTLPTDEVSLDKLSRTLGHRDRPQGTAAGQMLSTLRRHQLAVRAVHERVYFRPLLEAFADGGSGLSPESAVARLTAFGFTDARRTQAAVRELTRGLNRTSRLMRQLLPLLLDWLSASPDPDLGLLALRNLLADRTESSQRVVEVFRDSPEAARQLCKILGTSRFLGEIVRHEPDLVGRLPHADRLRTRPREELVASAAHAVVWRGEPNARQEALRRWKERHLFGIAARDLLHDADVEQVGADVTTLAEATLDAALASIDTPLPLAVIALGRLGAAEMSYASDLDVIFVHDGDGPGGAREADRVAARLVRMLNGSTPAERIFATDVDLRPEGRHGALTRSLEGFRAYWSGYAQTWERLAMVRARSVAGDRELGERMLREIEGAVWGGGLTAEELQEVRRIKARVERERIPVGEDPAFHLKLGRGSLSDVEFTVQMLQLRHGVRAGGTVAALAALNAAGVLAEEDAVVLDESYRFCELVRNRWYLVNSAPSDSLPTQPEPLLWLARSLDTTPIGLRDSYRRVTRRARSVVERVFYGMDRPTRA